MNNNDRMMDIEVDVDGNQQSHATTVLETAGAAVLVGGVKTPIVFDDN